MKYGYSYGVSITTGTGSSGGGFSNVNSFSFDGIDDYFLGTSTYSELDGLDNFALSFWIKPSTLVGYRLILSIGTNNADYRAQQIQIASNNGKIQVYVSNMSYYFTSTVSLTQDVWQHILVTRDSARPINAKGKVYINSVDSSSSDNTRYWSQSALSNSGLMIGKHNNSYGSVFNGNIDEVAIYTQDMAPYVSEIYGGGQAVDLNNLATAPQPTTWQRMGEDATWNGATWTMTDVNGGYVNRSINMIEANRTTDVPPNPFANTKSITLDGVDDYVELNSPTSIQSLTSAITISFWIKAPRVFSTNYYTPLSKGEYAAVGSQWSIKVNTANARNTVGGTFTTFSEANAISGRQNLNFPTPVDDNQWHHMMFVNDGTDLKIYLDGQLEATGVGQGGTLYDGNRSLKLGRLTSTSSTGLLQGNLDEVAIFGTALGLAEAQTIYNNGVPNNLTSLSPVSWWRFEEGSGTTAIDSGSGGNNGTLTNGVVRSTDVPFNYKSIALDGVDDYVDCGTGLGNSQGTITNFSVSMWIKPSVTSGNDLFFNVGNFSNSFGEIAFQLQSNNLFIKLDGSAYRVWVPYTNTTAWQHLVFVYDGGNSANTKMYINGTLQSPSTGGVHPSSLNLSGLKTIIGAGYSANYPYAGLQDEVSYFNTTLSQSDVTTIYNGGVPNDIASLNPLSWWRCGDGDTSPTLTDNGSASNDGTMTNFTTFSTDVPT